MWAISYYTSSVVDIFQAEYQWFNTTDNYKIYDPELTILNPYKGGMYIASRVQPVRSC